MKKILGWMYIFPIFFGCSAEKIHVQQANRVSESFTKYIKSNEPSCTTFSTGGSYIDNIQEIHLGFEFQQTFNINEARSFFVFYAEQFFNMINEDIAMRPFLRNYPVTINDIDLDFNFIDCRSRFFVRPPYIANVSTSKGKLFFAIENFNTLQLEFVHIEPYEESVRIVNEEESLFSVRPASLQR